MTYYGGCTEPPCVDMDALRTKASKLLAEGGTRRKIHGIPGWWYGADPNNFRNASRTKEEIDSVVIHTAEGYTGGMESFRDPTREASAHYAVQWDGALVQMVEDKDIAWHAGMKGSTGIKGMNNRSIGIEHTGFAHAMQPGTSTQWSRALLRSSAKLVAKLARAYKIPIDREHIIGHYEVDPDRRSDPGPHWPWNSYIRQVRWYYYRPYVLTGLALVLLSTMGAAAIRKRKRARRAQWAQG